MHKLIIIALAIGAAVAIALAAGHHGSRPQPWPPITAPRPGVPHPLTPAR